MIEDRQLMEKFNSLWTLSLRDAAENGEGTEPDKWLAMRYFKFGYEARQEKEVEMEGKVAIEGGPGPYEEDLKKAKVELEERVKTLGGYYNAKISGDQVREFFFVKGRESARVAVILEDGQVRANAGVRVAVSNEDNAAGYMHGDVPCLNPSCYDDDCEYTEFSIEDRLKKIGFDDVKVVEGKDF